MRFWQWWSRFLAGRYGADELFAVLTVFAAFLSFLNLFIRSYLLQAAVYALILFAFFRFLSRNHEQRRKENAYFKRKFLALRQMGELRKKQKNDPFHIYRRCPACHAILRLPRRAGKHNTVCPKCGKTFSVTVRGK